MTPTRQDASGPIIVRKYGGSSLATVERLRVVARDIAAARRAGNRLVVVVSAMGQTTDELDFLAHEANPSPPRRELDMLLSVGERITMSLLCMALEAERCPAISYTGSQCGIITDNSHTEARITEVRGDRVLESLDAGQVVVVAGFQGMSWPEKEITTLGRGGSDTTAVALAAALGARRCEILKDVDGLMTADPRRIDSARRHDTLSYGQLSAAVDSGCGVVHPRAARYAARKGVRLFIGSSFRSGPGTEVGPDVPAAPPATEPGDYRPVTMVVHGEATLIELRGEGTGPEREIREAALAALPEDAPLSEWLEHDPDEWRWSVLLPAAAGEACARELAGIFPADHAPAITECGCLGLAGNRPASWLIAERRLEELLEGLDRGEWRLRCDETSLRLLVPADRLDELAEAIHRRLFPA